MFNENTLKIIEILASVFSAIGTVSAVIVTLYLVRKQSIQKCKIILQPGAIVCFRNGVRKFSNDLSGFKVNKYEVACVHHAIVARIINLCQNEIALEKIYISSQKTSGAYTIRQSFLEPERKEHSIMPFSAEDIFINFYLLSSSEIALNTFFSKKSYLYIKTRMNSYFYIKIPTGLKDTMKSFLQNKSTCPSPTSTRSPNMIDIKELMVPSPRDGGAPD